jgi:hypothetical protein
MGTSSGKIRTEAEGRELWLPYAMEFLRHAEIQEIITCGEDDADGNPIVTERKLIAIVRRSDVEDAAQTLPPSSQPDQGVRIR